MPDIYRQCVGVDIAKGTFTACVCKVGLDGREHLSEVEGFKNSTNGFNQLVKWSRKHMDKDVPASFVMEATGIYYEPLAYHLARLKQRVSVVLPNKVKHYAKSLNVKTKTDATDARCIARMGAGRQLDAWEPPAPVLRELRALTRLYTHLKAQRTTFTNYLGSHLSGEGALDLVTKSHNSIVRMLDKQTEKCEEEIKELLYREEWLAPKVEKLLTIKGVGLTTVAIIVAETQGFKLVRSRRQLASYAGYDVVQRESGTSIKGKTRISKKGNSRIRAALYFPALVASRHDSHMKSLYERINGKRPSKMVGATAVQRKLLLLMYTLWKKDEAYKPEAERTSGNQEAKPLLRHGAAVKNGAGEPYGSPAQDGRPSNQSAGALLRQKPSS